MGGKEERSWVAGEEEKISVEEPQMDQTVICEGAILQS